VSLLCVKCQKVIILSPYPNHYGVCVKRGKPPPIDLKMVLTRSERLHKLVYKTGARAEPTPDQKRWLELNCGHCRWQNVDRLVTSILVQEPILWKHICVHPGPVKLVSENKKAPPAPSCGGFQPLE
jgi:hypothetical protein